MRTVLLKEMSTSKELVELSQLYTNITEKKETDKDKEDAKKEGELEKVLTNLKNNKKDDKEEIKGPNVTGVVRNKNTGEIIRVDRDKNNLSKTDKEDLKKSVKTYHATDRSGRDFDDPGADSDVRGGSKERKPITQDIKGSDGKVVGKKTTHPASPDYQKTFENPKKVDTSKLPSELTKGKEKEIAKANEPDYLGKAQGLLDREKWLAKTANSPAANAGLSDKQRWAAQTKHRQFQKDNNRGAFKVKNNPDTSGNEAKEASKAAALARRNAKLVDKGLKPPKSSTPKNFVETNPKTHYTSKIGAFLNNKKKGDLKGTTKHTITKIDHNNEEYDAYDLVLDYIMESKQASSIEEANYIMMEMDQNTIHEIVVEQKKTLGEGLAKLVGLGAAGYGLWKAGKWAKKKGDKALDGARKNMKIGGENRKKEIENKSGVDLDNW